MPTLIDDNAFAENNSFLYYLHEESLFDIDRLHDLCSYIQTRNSVTLKELRQLYFIQNQTVRHIAYHFDPRDGCEISNLPQDYWEYIEILDHAIDELEKISIEG